MKFRDPWIDPRIVQVKSADAQAYLQRRGWKALGPAPADPNLLLFDPPGDGDDTLLVPVPVDSTQDSDLQRMIEFITELALAEGRYAGDVLTEILQQATHAPTSPPNGAGRAGDVATTGS